MLLEQSRTYRKPDLLVFWLAVCFFVSCVHASYGDRLPEFRNCVEVCRQENCENTQSHIPFLHRILFWTCPSECDYTCQHIITETRVQSHEPVVQFHGKWPFYRFLGMQEPFSVLFSLLNFMAHQKGLGKIRAGIPSTHPLRVYYVFLAYFGMTSWIFSMIFHTRDFRITEQLDYFAAGASVLYGLYYTPIRVFELHKGGPRMDSLLRVWGVLCVCMYTAHVTYLKWYSWNYTYNMAANVAAGLVQNVLWSWFSIAKYQKSRRPWTAIPGIVVAWVLCAMSLELLDFPPLWGCLDAHSLWHLGTVIPTYLFYEFLLKDAQEEIATEHKA